MKEIKNISRKIKKTFYNTIVQAVLISFATMIIVAGVIILLLWTHRMDLVSFLINEYKSEHQPVAQIEIPLVDDKEVKEEIVTIPVLEKEETPTIVSAVKKARPAVVSVILNDKISSKQVGSGSGFLISLDGLIVTNRHVVSSDEVTLKVLLNNSMEYTATLLDRDPVLDVALLKISGSNFPYLKLADSDTLEVGETVIAIGNALGEFKNTVSAGVVSGLSRSITAGDSFGQMEYLDKVIQTDAAINRGNSGGPLLNINGQVVGINVAMVEGSSSIGFSLPINSVKDAINSVKKTGIISRPYVGVRYVLITPDLKIKNNLPFDYGILIQKGLNINNPAIIPNSPAEKAGLKEGDIILQIDGNKVDQNSNFSYFIRGKKIGDFVNMKVYSAGITKTVVVVLEQAPDL